MIGAYLILAVWFCAIDLIAGRVAGSPSRPVAAALLALVWPLSLAFALIAAAALVRSLREKTP